VTNRFSISNRLILAGLLGAEFVAFAAVVTAQPAEVAIVVSGIVVLAAVVAMNLDAVAGGGVGIIAAGMVVGLSRTLGRWDTSVYVATIVACGAAVVAPSLAGLLGHRVRRALNAPTGWAANIPAFGSLGLADASIGEPHLAEEMERARLTGRPLAVMRIVTEPRAGHDFTVAERLQIFRSAARVLESVTNVIDVPFAYADDDLVVILPETDEGQSKALVGRVRTGLEFSKIRDTGSGRERRPFNAVGVVRIGRIQFEHDDRTAAELIAGAHPDAGGRRVAGHGSAEGDEGRRAPRPAEALPGGISASRRASDTGRGS
jgi:Flp pilus assembly protein protease CpaA